MATTVIRYVDPNSSGGDGTTNALSGATAAYASLFAWEAARQRNLVTADEIERVICSSDDAGSTHAADTTAFSINGWTVDATRYIQIEAASSHGGIWNDNIYRLTTATNSIIIFVPHVKIIGLQISTAPTGTTAANCIWTDISTGIAIASITDVTKCILKFAGSSTGAQRAFRWDGDAGAVAGSIATIINTLMYDFTTATSAAVSCGDAEVTVNAYNCTIQNCALGVARTAGAITLKNVIFDTCTTDATGTITDTYCATTNNNTKGLTAAGTGNRFSQTFTYQAGTDNFHLASTDAGARDYGIDLSATFTDDIDGQTRPTGANTWDIGADEYVAAGGLSMAVAMHHYKMMRG